jgi:hypothetical protein
MTGQPMATGTVTSGRHWPKAQRMGLYELLNLQSVMVIETCVKVP